MRPDTKKWLLFAAQAWGIPAAADAELGPGIPLAPVLLDMPPFRIALFDVAMAGGRRITRRGDEQLEAFAARAWAAAGPSVRAWQRAGCLALSVNPGDVDRDPDAVLAGLTDLRALLVSVYQGAIPVEEVAQLVEVAA